MPLEIQVCHCHSLFTYVFKRALSSSSPLQVSHHPPAAAHHVISERGWNLRQEITVASKFRGKYLSIMPLGKMRRFLASEIANVTMFLQLEWVIIVGWCVISGLMWYSLHNTFFFPFSLLFLVFPCQAQFTPFLRRATITTHGRKSPPLCTTSLWESYG